MTDNAENLVLMILQDLQAKFSRFEDRMSNLELRCLLTLPIRGKRSRRVGSALARLQ